MGPAQVSGHAKSKPWEYSYERNNQLSREFRNPLENAGGSEVTTWFGPLRFLESLNPAEAPQ
jgi:hypothetical protein